MCRQPHALPKRLSDPSVRLLDAGVENVAQSKVGAVAHPVSAAIGVSLCKALQRSAECR